jgi:hypothetical protein
MSTVTTDLQGTETVGVECGTVGHHSDEREKVMSFRAHNVTTAERTGCSVGVIVSDVS